MFLFFLRNPDIIGRIAETQVPLFRQENSCRLQYFRYGLLLPFQLRLQIKQEESERIFDGTSFIIWKMMMMMMGVRRIEQLIIVFL